MIGLEAFPRVSLSSLTQLEAVQTTIITVNNRLARRIIQEFAQQSDGKKTVQEMPLVVPWSGWIAQQLVQAGFQDSLRTHSVLLDALSAQLLWDRVINELEADQPLLDTQQAASVAQQADKLMDDWRIKVDPAASTEEHAHFMLWRARYQQALERLDALDPNLAVERVIDHLRAGFPVRSNLLLAGFSEITPRMSELLEALQNNGVTISLFEQETPPHASLSRHVAQTSQDEWYAAARWACANLEQYPEGKFAIVALSLEAEAAFARRTLSRVLKAQNFSFNVAVARPLAEWQAIRAVLAWLRTFVLFKEQRKAKASDLGAALLAGFCAGDLVELGTRANVDAGWRRHHIADLNVAGWSKAIEGLTQLSPAWHLAWQAWATLPRQASVRFWSNTFRQTLVSLGFPGRSKQSSTTYQVIEALDHLFERFDALSPVLDSLSATEALSMLSRLARSVPFQPQRDPDARLDVLGMLEAEGGCWDGVWILGLTDEVFPAVARPNPFIPLSVLRRVGAPRATPEREREWAAHMYRQLCLLAPEVVFSAALHEGERSLRPSPLIQHIPLSATDVTLAQAPAWGAPLETIDDAQGPALCAEENVAGGVALLETQARNPLWAFMRYRLGADGLPAYSALPPLSVRGMFLHRVMEIVWKTLVTQSECQRVSETGALQEVLIDIIHAAADQELLAFHPALRALEEKRARSIVSAWLALECQRTPFVVAQIEEKHLLTVAGLTLNVRLDRMDQLEDGVRVVMDYKAGASLPKVLVDWQRERPVHLQLPAYAAVLAQEGILDSMAGLILVPLHSSAQKPAGLLNRDIQLQGPLRIEQADYPDADWSSAMLRLNKLVHTLAAEFTAGLALNQSWSRADLQYCDIPALLRRYDEALESTDPLLEVNANDSEGVPDGG